MTEPLRRIHAVSQLVERESKRAGHLAPTARRLRGSRELAALPQRNDLRDTFTGASFHLRTSHVRDGCELSDCARGIHGPGPRPQARASDSNTAISLTATPVRR